MPAKYLISKSILCNIGDLAAATEEGLWEEHRHLTEIFLETWNKVKSEKFDLIHNSDSEKISLMDLNVERMLKHCNFCCWQSEARIVSRNSAKVANQSFTHIDMRNDFMVMFALVGGGRSSDLYVIKH
jgi:hypothetical protein